MHTARNIVIGSIVLVLILGGLIYLNRNQNTGNNSAEGLVFYCAAGIKTPVEQIKSNYENEYGKTIQIDYGGSGALLSRIEVAKKGDLYLAGDPTYVELAHEKGLVEEIIPVAYFKPVIAFQKGNPKNIQSLEDLTRDNISLSLANPEAASVGRTVKELLEESGQWQKLTENAKVYKPTVNDIANDIKLGTVDAGIIWDAVAAQYPELEYIEVPELSKGRQQITIGVLSSSNQPTQALHFARYLTARDRGLKIFEEKGYKPTKGDVWADTPKVALFSGTVNRPAIDQTIEAFQKREGCLIDINYNGCGILVAQMKAGQRPDAYFACDVSFMHQVGDLFENPQEIAETDMVILVKDGNPKNINSLQDLTKEDLRVGVCNAEQSALGALTKHLLEEAGYYEEIMRNVVSQVPTGDLLVTQIREGPMDAAIVYRVNTAHVKEDEGDVIDIDHPAALAIQPFAIANYSDHAQLIQRLLSQIQSKKSQNKFKEVGFRWRGKPMNMN